MKHKNIIIHLLFQITEAMLCAGGEKNKDGCQVSMHVNRTVTKETSY